MKRFNNNLYTVERVTRKNRKLTIIRNDDNTLFSGCYKTKLMESDLPEWYVFGRYYKIWGFLSTKGISDMVYVPNLWINHFLKDDCLLISYGGQIQINPDEKSLERYTGYDEMIWGGEILAVLKGAEKFSNYNISDIVEQIREKKRILIEKHPDEFGDGKWDFDIDEWLKSDFSNRRPSCFSKKDAESVE